MIDAARMDFLMQTLQQHVDALDPESAPTVAYAKGLITLDAATAQGVTIPGGTTPLKALLMIESGDVRYYYDGSTPTSSDGLPMYQGDAYVISGATNISQFRAISMSGAAVLRYTLEQ